MWGFTLLQKFELDVNINTDVLLNKITEKYVAFIPVCVLALESSLSRRAVKYKECTDSRVCSQFTKL